MIIGSFTKCPVGFGAKGQNGLEPAICCTLWREQYLPRGVKPQTEFTGLFGANFFWPFGAKAYSSWFSVYRESVKKFWELWRQVIILALLSKLLVPNSACFSGSRKRVHEFLLQTKQYATCLRKMTTHVPYSLS